MVLDETRGRLHLHAGAVPLPGRPALRRGRRPDPLSVRPSPADGIDFEYVIHNHDGGEVELLRQRRPLLRAHVRDQGLTTRTWCASGFGQQHAGAFSPAPMARVTVDMGPPYGAGGDPFDAAGPARSPPGSWQKWPLAPADPAQVLPFL